MNHIDKIGYKQYGEYTQEIPNDGYMVEMSPNYFYSTCYVDEYCREINIMIKIINNDEGYFDFSKNLLDIGSHIGTYDLVLDFNHYYMFEGNNEYCVISQFNMLLHNKLNKCNCYNVLLSDIIEDINYDGFETDYYKTINNKDIYNIENTEVCKTKILDHYNLNNIGLIKIDVEGMEYKVLKGGLGTIIRNNYPPILFELWDVGYLGMTQELHDQLQKFLEDLGYTIFWKWGDGETHLAIHK